MGKKHNGYILLHRAIDDSDIATKPPHFRELWFWLLRGAEPFDCSRKGRKLKRGQLLLVNNYEDIYEGLRWFKGAIKITYSKADINSAFRYLRRALMVHTARTTVGLIITILNYDEYQAPASYEEDSGAHSGNDSLSLYKELRTKHIKRHYENLSFPDAFPVNKFYDWELARKKKYGVLKDKARKAALTSLTNALKRKALLKAMGYNSMSELLDRAIEAPWRGFAWLKQEMNKVETRQESYQAAKVNAEARPQPEARTHEEQMQEMYGDNWKEILNDSSEE